MKEVALSEPVRKWIKSRGFTPYAEIPFLYHCHDWVGVNWTDRRLIVVEMKVHLSEKVMRQAYGSDLFSNEAWVAIGTNPKRKGLERSKRFGVGVISVHDGNAVTLIEAKKRDTRKDVWKRKLLERLDGVEEGGIAGNPTLGGCGPAQDCYDRVQEYREAHPKATWAELFENVHNHYCSANSMCGQMSKVGHDRKYSSK